MKMDIVDGHADLNMGEWAVAESSDILETGGASTCGIVAVLNHSQGRAWMVHQTAPSMILDDAQEMLSDVSLHIQPGDSIEIWFAGCGPGHTQAADQQALSELVAGTLPSYPPKIHWGQETLVLSFGAGAWAATFD